MVSTDVDVIKSLSFVRSLVAVGSAEEVMYPAPFVNWLLFVGIVGLLRIVLTPVDAFQSLLTWLEGIDGLFDKLL